MLGDLFYQLGVAVGELETRVRGKAGAGARRDAASAASAEAESDTGREVGEAADDLGPDASGALDGEVRALAATGAAWLVARFLRPRPVRWHRVLVAGVAATLLADLVGRAEEEAGPGARSGGLPFARDPDELLRRIGAGLAVAAGYAALVYPRLPGPPLLRGLAFGALEIAAAPRGGLMRMALDTPGLKLPLRALAAPVDRDAGPLSHLAFGLGLGLFYDAGRDTDPDVGRDGREND